MTELTLKPGVLKVASAFPDPPFEVNIDGKRTGFGLRKAVAEICTVAAAYEKDRR